MKIFFFHWAIIIIDELMAKVMRWYRRNEVVFF